MSIYRPRVWDEVEMQVSINEALDEIAIDTNRVERDTLDLIDKVKRTGEGLHFIKVMREEGKSKEDIDLMLLTEAKKSKKKKEKAKKANNTDNDIKEKEKSDKDTDSDDINIDDIGNSKDIPDANVDDDDDSDDDKEDKKKKDDNKEDKKSKDDDSDDDLKDLDLKDDIESSSSDKKSKKKKKKDDEDSDDSDDDKEVKKSKESDDGKDDTKDNKIKDKVKNKKKKDKDDVTDNGSDLKLEYGIWSSNYIRHFKTPIEMLSEAFDRILNENECGSVECGSNECGTTEGGRGKHKKSKNKKGKNIVKGSGKSRLKEMIGEARLSPDYQYPHKTPLFEKVVREYFDLSDRTTRNILVTVNEEDQNIVLHSLTNKLYDIIVDKSATIDYGGIPETEGDIERLQNYSKIEECIETIRQILIEYKEDTNSVDQIKMAIDNITERKDLFKRCFLSKVEFGIVTYNTMVLGIIAATSLMISASITFIKSPEDESFQLALDKVGYHKAKNALLFNNIQRFNNICKDKSFDRCMDNIIRETGRQFLGLSSLGGFAVATLITVVLFNILPLLREMTYFFYFTRTRISDYFNLQADLLELNAHKLESGNGTTVGDRKTVIKRQKAIAERFRQVADFFMVENKKAEAATVVEVRKDERKYQADEVLDDVPDSSKSALF